MKPDKRLKERGVKQESLYAWSDDYVVESGTGDGLSAFTVAELGEMLPAKIKALKKVNSHEHIWKSGGASIVFEADTRARMFVYLLENKRITPGAREDV